MLLTGKGRTAGRKPVPVPICPPQIPHREAGDEPGAPRVKDR